MDFRNFSAASFFISLYITYTIEKSIEDCNKQYQIDKLQTIYNRQ